MQSRDHACLARSDPSGTASTEDLSSLTRDTVDSRRPRHRIGTTARSPTLLASRRDRRNGRPDLQTPPLRESGRPVALASAVSIRHKSPFPPAVSLGLLSGRRDVAARLLLPSALTPAAAPAAARG